MVVLHIYCEFSKWTLDVTSDVYCHGNCREGILEGNINQSYRQI